jgi:hypothetical protein
MKVLVAIQTNKSAGETLASSQPDAEMLKECLSNARKAVREIWMKDVGMER